jgi:hypothetical protein
MFALADLDDGGIARIQISSSQAEFILDPMNPGRLK